MTTKVKPSVLADTAVTTGTYGGSTQHAVFQVDQQGRLVYAGNATPSIASSQITGQLNASQINTVANTQITGVITPQQVANNQTYAISANGISSGSWTITTSGTKLNFAYNGTIVCSLDSTGNVISKANVTTFGTP